MQKRAKISIVGAGPGDPELITIKGAKALQSADVILYDALIHPEILSLTSSDALKIYVGKRERNHAFKQEEINKMIVDYAYNYGHVVRLKGGDPFVFGRGHEELTYIKAFDIPVEIIPGISSAISLPALQEIPLTKRGINESFWVLTATTSEGRFSNDIELAAQSSATIIVLMGLKKLEKIVETFIDAGKNDIPVAIIQNGSMENEKVVVGQIENIAYKARAEKIGTPAIIVIGDVVAEHPAFNHQFVVEKYLKKAV